MPRPRTDDSLKSRPAVTRFADRYDLHELLGKGSYGFVHRAFDRNQRQDVALKTFSQGAGLGLATKEAIVLTALESHNILRVYNAAIYQDVPYLATAIAKLRSTQDWMDRKGHPVPVDLAIKWARHALVGLSVCHQRGLLHRDIKPSNLFLQSADHCLLGDFGTATTLDANGAALADGTLLFQAPEGLVSNTLTVRSDIYSLGVTMYNLLTGQCPFGGTDAKVRSQITSGNFARLRDIAPHVPRVVAMRVERAMSLDPDDRYESADEMHQDLGRLAAQRRDWCMVSDHPGHEQCWQSDGARGVAALNMCVVPAGRRFEITTRRVDGSRSRVLLGCQAAANRAALPKVLRMIFDSLEK
jgi:serine/threonine protein kinase